MQYALVNNERTTPKKGLKGICTCCGSEVVAKCGNIKLHHWAHKSNAECDSWWETETEWHREWKSYFPEDCREIPFTDSNTGEVHRADVHTSAGITFEFQNSTIKITELQSRELFYKKMIWVVNGLKFINSFEVIKNIPNPFDPLLDTFDFRGEVFVKKEEISTYGIVGSLLYSQQSDELKNLMSSDIHFSFKWKNKHQAWFHSQAPVFIDFGDDKLYWLRKRPQAEEPFWYIQVVSKKEFITKYAGSDLPSVS